MALTEATSALCTAVEPRRWRLFLVVFLVRMWRLNACPRLMDPLPRTTKRLAAPRLVFILGMIKLCCDLWPQVAAKLKTALVKPTDGQGGFKRRSIQTPGPRKAIYYFPGKSTAARRCLRRYYFRCRCVLQPAVLQ